MNESVRNLAGIRQSERAFGLMFAAVFAVIALVGWLAFDARLYWVMAAAGLFLVTALAVPWVLLPLNRLWAVFARRLGGLNNYVLLGLFFYVFIVPAGLILRLLGRDPMCRGFDAKAPTYWTPVTRRTDAETLRDMF
jgi:predicted nucleic acid-binding Zn ribbon protein